MNDETPKKAMADKRKLRRQQEAAANKINFILDTKVRRFVMRQAKEAGMDIAPFMQKIVENHVMASAPEGDPLAERLKAKRAVLDQAVALASKTQAEGGFDEHFILNVMKNAYQEAEFKSLYDQAVGADDDKATRRDRVSLNQQLGRLIKRAAGAKSKRDENGKIMRAQVQGQILTSYTLLDMAA
ncbi:MAG: hypothetical protein ACI8R4_000508 [Paracoccaceae bacterium]|jgi:hypothetical protein